MAHPSIRRDSFAALLLATAAAAMMLLPHEAGVAVKSTVRDSVLPGERLARWMRTEWLRLTSRASPRRRTAGARDRTAATDALARRLRALQVENAELRQRLEEQRRLAALPVVASPGEPLIVPQLVEATVLGGESAERWRAGRLIDRGTGAGLVEEALVLESAGPLIDQGHDGGLETGLPVYAGRTVVGRIAAAGRWTSTVRLVTDPDYRGLARLVREASEGYAWGAEGTCEGTGAARLRLTHVPATEPVSVGDAVFTAERDPSVPAPMYYGKVVEAELPPGALYWDIEVEPAVRLAGLETVQVLRRGLNPARLMAH